MEWRGDTGERGGALTTVTLSLSLSASSNIYVITYIYIYVVCASFEWLTNGWWKGKGEGVYDYLSFMSRARSLRTV